MITVRPVVRPTIVTVDLDSTLCDTAHRHQMIDRVNGTDWKAYSQACGDDEVVEATKVLVQALHLTHEIHYVTGRNGIARPETLWWLNRHEIPYDGLWMDEGASEDYTSLHQHTEYKLARIRSVERETGKKVILHVDDWAGVKMVLEKDGIPCLCVRTPQEIEALIEQESELR